MSAPPDPHDALALLRQRLHALPWLSAEVAPVRAQFKQAPEDFVVEELPAYEPTGSGEHLYLWVEKRNLNTHDVVGRLARALGARSEGAGYAGLKDRNAITRQWLSFHHPGTPDREALDSEGLRVLAVTRHVNKLRTGHLRGNRFLLRLTGVPPEHDEAARAVLGQLAERGLPNYYGSQRFGQEGKNLAAAWAWIVAGERAPKAPFLRKLFVSTLQAALFNVWLADRMDDGLLGTALSGDLLRKEETGGLFRCDDPILDGPRVASWEISATGPMFGARMRAAEADAGERERALLARYGVTEEQLTRVQKYGEGTRRPARVRVDDVDLRREGDDVMLSFALPKGAYATVLLAELTKTRDLTLGDDP